MQSYSVVMKLTLRFPPRSKADRPSSGLLCHGQHFFNVLMVVWLQGSIILHRRGYWVEADGLLYLDKPQVCKVCSLLRPLPDIAVSHLLRPSMQAGSPLRFEWFLVVLDRREWSALEPMVVMRPYNIDMKGHTVCRLPACLDDRGLAQQTLYVCPLGSITSLHCC